MDFKQTAKDLLDDSTSTSIRALSAIAEAEKYLQQAYEGRYFFELIQNIRDANKEINKNGKIFIEFKNNMLSVANTGAEFSNAGIEGITTIGQSTKQSQDYIGFKGIGFKSIQEVTDTPKIITRHGSIYFDRKLTLDILNESTLKEEQIPLFFFPHYNDRKLTSECIEKGIVTRIELPLKENITENDVVNSFSEIQAKQLILLGNIDTLSFITETRQTTLSIKKIKSKSVIEVHIDNDPVLKYKYYSPKNKITLPNVITNLLEGKEKEIFGDNTLIDINIVLELDNNGRIIPIEEAKLYLFYPLQISSGFRFIIHSYFLVNPERTALRNSPLNNYLLKSIGEFIGSEMLRSLKKNKANTTNILCFKRNEDAKICELYDSLVTALDKQKFIYDNKTKRYYSSSEVIVADGFDKGLFPDGKFGGRQLIYTDDQDVKAWLQYEFDVPYLTYDKISSEIENECKRQLKLRNVKFFQNLYNYVSTNEDLDLTSRKVLLTSNFKLVSSENDVFYGGSRREDIVLSKSIKNKIYFIHDEIKISDFREGRSRTGIIEFKTFELVRRLLKLFKISSIPKIDLLKAIFSIQSLDARSELEIREKILLPIKGDNKWLSPLYNSIYFEKPELLELYPNGSFIDESLLSSDDIALTDKDIHRLLKSFGVWGIPAVYVSSTSIRINSREKRDQLLEECSGLTSRPFYIQNDRLLDIPVKYNKWFSETIINNWDTYQSFIVSSLIPKLTYHTGQSYKRNATDNQTIPLSGCVEALADNDWVSIDGSLTPCNINEIVGVDILDIKQAHNYVLGKYLHLLPINYVLKKSLAKSIGMLHLSGDSIDNYIRILNLIYEKYTDDIPDKKSFIDFYNRILGKVVDYFFNYNIDNYERFSTVHFLAVDDLTGEKSWKRAEDIFYIDDKANYDILPISIKEKVQPQFTKRDRNTFGRIANKIGKKFSDSIKKELVYSDVIQEEQLVTYFGYLPQCIAILESLLDSVIDEHFDKLINSRILISKKLNVIVSVYNSDELEIYVNHFIDDESNYDIYLSEDIGIDSNRRTSEFINELFVSILGRNLQRFSSDIFHFLNSKEKDQYLKDYDISDERIDEIRNKLNTSHLTQNQQFWDVIIDAKGITDRSNLFIEKGVDCALLSKLLGIDNVAVVERIQSNLDFRNINNINNLDLLILLFRKTSLSLEVVNSALFPKINFKENYEKELFRIKNNFEHSFNFSLFSSLANTNDAMLQSEYQDILDNYKYHFDISIPFNTLEFSAEQFFVEKLNSEFDFYIFDVSELNNNEKAFNPTVIYSNNYTLFLNKISHFNQRDEYIDLFLSKNNIRSLLYFNNTELLVKKFSAWLNQHEKQQTPSTNEESFEEYLQGFFNPKGLDIESISTYEVDSAPSYSGSSGGGNGNRYDGSATNHNKQNIGLIAELSVYNKLAELYESVTWVSKYASKIPISHPGYNPEGQDGLGYDIEYLDSESNKYYVEVKGKSDDYNSFEISKNELYKARQEKEFYKVVFVSHALNNSQRRILDLENLFILSNGEDFLSNTKFTAIYKNFEIRFNEK